LLLDKGVKVPVNIFPEAENPRDNQAIAFKWSSAYFNLMILKSDINALLPE